MWHVEIIRSETEEIEKTLGPYASEHLAEKADAGVNKNLDDFNFYTLVIEEDNESD